MFEIRDLYQRLVEALHRRGVAAETLPARERPPTPRPVPRPATEAATDFTVLAP
jgi:hypothetical protein